MQREGFYAYGGKELAKQAWKIANGVCASERFSNYARGWLIFHINCVCIRYLWGLITFLMAEVSQVEILNGEKNEIYILSVITWSGEEGKSQILPQSSVSAFRDWDRGLARTPHSRRAWKKSKSECTPLQKRNDSDPIETQMGGSARGGDLGREWIAPPTATGTRSSVWVCVSLLSAAVEREQLGAWSGLLFPSIVLLLPSTFQLL